MPLDFKCSRCGKPIDEPGGILLTPPVSTRLSAVRQQAKEVYDITNEQAFDWIESLTWTPPAPMPHAALVWKAHICVNCAQS